MHQQLGQQPINKDNKTWITYTLCCKLNSESTASVYHCGYSSWELDSGCWGLWLFCRGREEGNNKTTQCFQFWKRVFFMIQLSKPLKVIIFSKTRPVRLIVLLHKEVSRLIALPVFFLFLFWKSVRLWNRLRSFLPSFLYLSIKGERRFWLLMNYDGLWICLLLEIVPMKTSQRDIMWRGSNNWRKRKAAKKGED